MLSCRIVLCSALLGLADGCAEPAQDACPSQAPTECSASAPTYETGIGTLLIERCSPCHAAGGVEASRLLTSYERVAGERMSIASQLWTCSMPPAGAPPLSAMERSQVLGWLACGAAR